MNKFNLKLIFLFLFSGLSAYSQLNITFPVSRIVFQRNNANQSTFLIYGTYAQTADLIEARVVPVVTGQGTATSWTTIATNPVNGIFKGTLQANGGWYNLEVRSKLAGNVVETATLSKVGIGEVFIVSGQSNAEGNAVYTGATIGATDDRVSCIDSSLLFLDEERLPFAFSQMANGSKMAPLHNVPYFWSRLGDLLAAQHNVPILFYGSAMGGTASSVWSRTANGEDLRNIEPFFVKVPGNTYRAIKTAIQQFALRTGVRAVLWMQGESDTNTPTQQYFDNINTIIQQSRKDSRNNSLTWVIARTGTVSGGYQPRDAQNRLGTEISNVFLGPITDDLQGTTNRENGHFAGQGLINVANMWKDQFTNINFFTSSSPTLPEIPLNTTCQALPSLIHPATSIYALPGSKLLNFNITQNFQMGTPSAGYSYAYITTRVSDDIILNISTTSPNLTNSTTYPAQQYYIRGIHYANSLNLSTYIGGTFANLQTQITNGSICADLSSNLVSVFLKSNLCPDQEFTRSGNSQAGTWVPIFIESNQKIYSTEKVITNSRVFYDSDKAIILQPGFKVDAGAIFIAVPDGCGGIANFYNF